MTFFLYGQYIKLKEEHLICAKFLSTLLISVNFVYNNILTSHTISVINVIKSVYWHLDWHLCPLHTQLISARHDSFFIWIFWFARHTLLTPNYLLICLLLFTLLIYFNLLEGMKLKKPIIFMKFNYFYNLTDVISYFLFWLIARGDMIQYGIFVLFEHFILSVLFYTFSIFFLCILNFLIYLYKKLAKRCCCLVTTWKKNDTKQNLTFTFSCKYFPSLGIYLGNQYLIDVYLHTQLIIKSCNHYKLVCGGVALQDLFPTWVKLNISNSF